MKIIERGGKLAVRLADLKNQSLLTFRGIEFYDISPEFRVKAKFFSYRPLKKIKIATVAGYEEELECPGVA
jgi:uncharacterized protein (DUF1684 family)